jgi:hypothetical protein
LLIQYFNGTSAQTTSFMPGGGYGAPYPEPRIRGTPSSVSFERLRQLALDPPPLPRTGHPLPWLVALELILYPTATGPGSLTERCAGIAGAPGQVDLCMATGVSQCRPQLNASCQFGTCWWRDTNCTTQQPTSQYDWLLWSKTNGNWDGAQSGSYDYATYPSIADGQFTNYGYGYRNSEVDLALLQLEATLQAQCVTDPNCFLETDTITDEQYGYLEDEFGWDIIEIPVLDPLADVHPTQEEQDPQTQVSPIPNIWEPLPLPVEIPFDMTPQEMNPGGQPQETTTRPALQPAVIDWPAGVGTGTPPTNPADPALAVDVTVNFPANQDVTVTNFPATDAFDNVAPIPLTDFVFDLSIDPGWLPASCPGPQFVEVFNQTIAIPYDPFCLFATRIAPILIALSLLVGIRLAWGAIR